ncbi:FolA Dihydrofolate reductase [Burkholderiaceae bacterium]
MQLSLIVAYAQNRVIGRDNTLPWKLPSDLAHFKRTTLGHPIIMGRKTWESLGRPLPGRRNIVISRDANYPAQGAECVTSLAQAIAAVQDLEEAFVIGGAQIYQEALPFAQQVIATEVQESVEGDAFFAPLDKAQWIEASRQSHPTENGLRFDIVHYQRKDCGQMEKA